MAHRDLYAKHNWNSNQFTNRYSEFFHADQGLIEITTDDAASNRVLLIVGDSYSNSIERLFAAEYRTVYVVDPRHRSEKLDQFLCEHPDVTDVLFLMSDTYLFSEEAAAVL